MSKSESETTQLRLNGTAKETRVGHCKYDQHDVYIGRGSHGNATMMNTDVYDRGWLGNPFTLEKYGRVKSIEYFRIEFEARLEKDDEFRDAVRDLHGQILGCWCRQLGGGSKSCHGDVIAEHADRLAREAEDT